jgi:hypothetical protein
MAEATEAPDRLLELADAIGLVRQQLVAAQLEPRRAPSTAESQM